MISRQLNRQTYIKSFRVIKPADELETVGEILTMSIFGEFCPANSLRGYSLYELISAPEHYEVYEIFQRGTTYRLKSVGGLP